jgi:hypothetical protein
MRRPVCAHRAHAAWGRRAHRLEPGPATAPVVAWMFAQRLAGHSAARITRALNDAGVSCTSAADPKRNPHLCDGGHEKLPIDGQIAARWRTSELPGGGH